VRARAAVALARITERPMSGIARLVAAHAELRVNVFASSVARRVLRERGASSRAHAHVVVVLLLVLLWGVRWAQP
jgi:hypothetical protein